MNDRMRDVLDAPPARVADRAGTADPSRRQVLVGAVAATALVPVLAACGAGSGTGSDDTDALLALADQARADAALVVAAVTADPTLAGRLEPLRAARTDHAGALDAAGGRTGPPPPSPPAPDTTDLARVRDAAMAAARAAGAVVPQAPPTSVGLLAEISACCATYGAVLM